MPFVPLYTGWKAAAVTAFRRLRVTGEALLLSVGRMLLGNPWGQSLQLTSLNSRIESRCSSVASSASMSFGRSPIRFTGLPW